MPLVVSSTDSAGGVALHTTSAFEASAPTSIVVPITTTNAQGQSITTSATVPAAVMTTTDAQGHEITTTSALASVQVGPGGSIITSAPAPGSNAGANSQLETMTDQYGNTVVLSGNHIGDVITTTDAKGRTVTETFTPGGGAVSQLVLETTTLPDGQKSTITSLIAVGGGGATSTPAMGGSAHPTSTSKGKPGLQSGASTPHDWKLSTMAALLAAAIGAAAFL